MFHAISEGIDGSKTLIDALEALLLKEVLPRISPGLQIIDRIQQRLTDLQTIANTLSSASQDDICSGDFEHLTGDLRLHEIRILLVEPVGTGAADKPETPALPVIF